MWAFALREGAASSITSMANDLSREQYGKLSDIYGRKAMLMTAYTIFGLGCAMWYVSGAAVQHSRTCQIAGG
jgi:MFS family permease